VLTAQKALTFHKLTQYCSACEARDQAHWRDWDFGQKRIKAIGVD